MRPLLTAVLTLCLAATSSSAPFKKNQRGETAFLSEDAPSKTPAKTSAAPTPPSRKKSSRTPSLPPQPQPLPRKDVTSGIIEAITFAEARGEIYLPVSEANYYLGRRVRHDVSRKLVRIDRQSIPESSLRHLVDGTVLISLADFERAGIPVIRHRNGKLFNIGERDDFFTVAINSKRTEINLATQRLKAWQGERLVLQCRVSTGSNRGSTPTGTFRAGPYKNKLHLSSLYDNSPMPWSVQVTGHIFIHGYSYVPHHPASHGCIRVPLDEGNPANFFYEWVDSGSSIRVVNRGSSTGAPVPVMLPPAADAPPAEKERFKFGPFDRRR